MLSEESCYTDALFNQAYPPKTAGSDWRPVKHFFLILALGALIWALLLRFYFPGYLDPFVPYHLDHYIYLGDSGQGYGLSRYILTYPRPLGNVFFDLLGRLGIRGMLVPVFLLALVNAGLFITYLERLIHRSISFLAIAFFLVLVFGNPESYASVKEDILSAICLFCVLIIFHLWQNYVVSGKVVHLAVAVVLAILASYVKETYFAALVFFFVLQAIFVKERRKAALVMTVLNMVIAGISFAYNARFAIFVNMHDKVSGPYYQDWNPLSILHSLAHLLKWLVLPVPALLVLASLIALAAARKHRSLVIALSSLAFIVSILLPNSVLPNHLLDQYAWLGAFFFFAPVLLAESLVPRTKAAVAAALAGVIVVSMFTLGEDRKDLRGMEGWFREQEKLSQNFLETLPTLRANAKPGEHELVLGLTLPFNPFRVPGFVRKYLGPKTTWTVVLPDEFPVKSELTTELVHRADLKPAPYDHIFVFTPEAHLSGLYTKKEAEALRKCGDARLP